jgi:SNF2 family DNA or RNA helicase
MTAVEAPWPEGISRLKRIGLSIPVEVTLPSTDVFVLPDNSQSSREEFDLRHDLARLSLLKGFDTLLCLERLKGVEHFWYQTETVRKVLKQFRGRVLLGDEVGLGKTIEAGMILKEYLLRGMIHRVLILTPASLVGQWKEEMLSKFEVEFSTTQDVLLQRDPAAFWAQPRIIASIATARLEPHFSRIADQSIDLVVVDEAHHLRNRTSRNWKLVDVLRKRFLLLLSATPVQNNLVELYNLLTLLKPGIFKTEKEFRARYMTPGNPRAPVNRGALQDLMRDVMIRNTRTLVDVRLPARHALTTRVAPTEEEAGCYQELSRLIRLVPRPDLERHRLALHHVLAAAGSSPAAAAAALRRFVAHVSERPWTELATRYTNIFEAGKARALLELLKRNPGEKKLVFSRLHETLNSLERALTCAGFSYARFDGTMTGPEKDEAVRLFRTDAEILLCSEAGGEGRNLQFCNTLINFDLPWNPQLIEQRIGRIHRIGQTREVFVFNLTAGGTLEDRILSILDEKLNMFELVVGEMQSILGHFNHERDFAEVVFAAWVEEAETTRESAFQKLALDLTRARRDYDAAKALDQDLFGEELEAV